MMSKPSDSTPGPMTNTERLLAAGWTRVARTGADCGEALLTRKALIGLACGRRAAWTRDGLGFAVCAQHAIIRDADNTAGRP